MRRRWANLPLRAKVLVVLAVPLVPLVVSAVLVILSARQERAAQQWVTHSLEVQAQVEATLVLTVEANASVEAFLLTHRREALQPFMALGQQWPATMQRLVDLVRDNPEQVERLKVIAALQGKNPPVTLVQYSLAHPDEAIPETMLADNEKVIDAFRSDLADMHAVEDSTAGRSWGGVGTGTARAGDHNACGRGPRPGAVRRGAMAFAAGITGSVERARQKAERLAHGDERCRVPRNGMTRSVRWPGASARCLGPPRQGA